MFGSVHYARTYVKSPRRQKAVLLFGFDYWLRLWLNGSPVIEYMDGQGFPSKGKFNLKIELEQGWNELLLKIASGSTGNGFWMSVSDLEGLEFSLLPHGEACSDGHAEL
jgi:hypothetical protein